MMQKTTLILILAIILISINCSAQDGDKQDGDYRSGKWYISNEIEMIFSFADTQNDSMNMESILRWSPIFNYLGRMNYDFNKHLGFDMGFGIRNVGFIAKFPGEPNSLKKKYRTYNLGIPVGIKIGDLNQKNPFFLFAGVELEMPFNYKEKTFENGDKTVKINGWFSNRTDRFTNSAYAGIQFPNGLSLKFKYYLKNFFNEDYKIVQDGISIKPYANMDVHVFYFSLSWFPFRDTKSYDIDMPNEEYKTTTAGWY